jgi:hypothetical protein
MDAVRSVDANSSDEMLPSMITIEKRGREVTILWSTAWSSGEFAVTNPSQRQLLEGVLKLIWPPKNTPTSASPQG